MPEPLWDLLMCLQDWKIPAIDPADQRQRDKPALWGGRSPHLPKPPFPKVFAGKRNSKKFGVFSSA